MQWQQILESVLSTSPLTGALGFALWKLWARNEAKDLEIARLNQQMVTQLLELANRDD